MGRHRAAHARIRRRDSVLLYGSVFVVLGGTAWLGLEFVAGRLGAADCDQTTTISIAAAPDIAPAIREIAGKQPPESDDGEIGCIRPRARAQNPAAMRTALSGPGMAARSLGAPTDVWIPDASSWPDLTRGGQEWKLPERGVSIATSPVVFAMDETLARESGWPRTPLDATDIMTADNGPRAGVTDPGRNSAELLGVQGIVRAVRNDAAITEAMRELAPGGGTKIRAFPASERHVLRHNENADPGTPGSLAAAYSPELSWLDYPYLILPSIPDRQRVASERFLTALRTGRATEILGAHGFRTPGGRLRGEHGEQGEHGDDERIDAGAGKPVPVPGLRDITYTLQQWARATAAGHTLAVIDVSGSMAAAVPGTGRTRMEITVGAAAAGLRLFNPGTELGIWEFSTGLDGDRDYRQVLPYGEVRRHIAGLFGDDRDPASNAAKLGGLLSPPRGATGLYDSTLAAYREAMRTWDATKMNSLIILTDGRNEDPYGIDRQRLLAELGRLTDPERPLPIVLIGLGTAVDSGELDDITRITGGQTFLAPDVADIKKIFFTALSTMSCAGVACRG